MKEFQKSDFSMHQQSANDVIESLIKFLTDKIKIKLKEKDNDRR
jgi:hypothetical protein